MPGLFCRALDSPASSQDDDEALPAGLTAALGRPPMPGSSAGSDGSGDGGSAGDDSDVGCGGGMEVPPDESDPEAVAAPSEETAEEAEEAVAKGDEAHSSEVR